MSCSPLATKIAHNPELCQNVSVIFIEATPDIGMWAKVPQLSGYFRCSGVETFYFDPDKHGDENVLASWIYHEKVVRGRRVVLACWSYGVVNALDALKILKCRNVCVDTLVGVDCFWLNYHRGKHLQPANVGRVVLVYREGTELPVGFCNPVVYRVDTEHLQMMGHPCTVNVLFRETLRLGQIDGYIQPEPEPVPAVHVSEVQVPAVSVAE